MTFQTVFKSEKEFEEFKTWTLGVLRDETSKDVCVTFTKKDGSNRDMFCTLVESRIPTDKQPKTETTSKDSGSALRVFDTEKQEWRSFRWDSVTKVGFNL
jgi:hypothetical protein